MIKKYIFLILFISLQTAAKGNDEIISMLSAPSVPYGTSQRTLLKQDKIDLTLQEAIALGLRNNPRIRIAYLDRVTQKFDLKVTNDIFNPQLALRAGYTINTSDQGNVHNTNLVPVASLLTPYGTQFSLSWAQDLNFSDYADNYRRDGLDLAIVQPLLKGFGREVNAVPVKQAKINEQINRLRLKSTVSSTVSEIIRSYRELLRAQERLAISEAALLRAKDQFSINKSLVDLGRMADFDIVQNEAQIASQELALEDALNTLTTSQMRLARVIGVQSDGNIFAGDALVIKPVSIDLEKAFVLAKTQEPQYLVTLLGGESAAISLLKAKDNERWELSLAVGATQQRYQGQGNQANYDWESYAGLQLKIPIGDLNSRQQTMQAQVNVINQKIDQDEAKRDLKQRIDEIFRELGTRWRQYQIALRTVELSKKKLEIEKEKLRLGRSSNFQVISYEDSLRDSENYRLNTLISYLNAQTELDSVLGMTLESWSVSLND
ncbi:TolC family protein [Serratia quinivorans]|uniref:TolC family protein n=1 Tax=Serratia quinivorans TaxID=137545 RepID=UPI00217AF592|nr:TolC family protein [Serratia quinivorans]CAI0969784.1 type I secretion outer membrane protein, TolC family [Serratia quinivorans]CAI1711387.1 type I secretion outer membrane protein, TolC family [Serratia quinivorans]